MNKVWIVAVADCEGNCIKSICSTKEIAERELFKARDELIEEWRGAIELFKLRSAIYEVDDMYTNMIKNLSGDDYENWDNFPHECPYLYEMEVIEK